MTETPEIIHETASGGGRYFVRLDDDGPEARMTYKTTAPGIITIDHTFVPNEFRGHGVAAALVNRAITDARQNNTKIIPQCSYVAAQFHRHPEWADLLAR